MKIEIDLKILLLMVLFFFLKRINIYTIFIIFIFIHEIAHMLVGIIVGFKPKILKFNPLGVSIEFYNFQRVGNKKIVKKIVTYLAGPVANFILAFSFLKLDINIIMKNEIIYTNLLLGIFNLLPISPLDGGKILKEILIFLVGNRDANFFMVLLTKTILIIFSLIYSIAIFKIKNIEIFLVLIYLWYLYYIEYKKFKLINRVYKLIHYY